MKRWVYFGCIMLTLLLFVNFGEYSFVVTQKAIGYWWDWNFRSLPVATGEGYKLLYNENFGDSKELLLQISDEYMAWLDDYFGYSPPRPRIFVTDSAHLNQILGGQYSLETSGAYQAGVVLISLVEPVTAQTIADSALLHELGHHYVHYLARGNYPVWYSEGVAQLLEMRLLGYRWFDGVEKYDYYMYSIEEMSRRFHSLDDQVSAYRQALGLAILIQEIGGGHAHRDLMAELGRGTHFPRALKLITGLSLQQLFELWFEENNKEGASYWLS